LNRILHIALLILVLSQTSNCQTVKNETLKVFRTEEYSISYPPILKLDDSGVDGTQFILFIEKDDEKDRFVENINLISQDLTNMSLDLDELIEITKTELKDFGEIVESKKLSNKGYNYHKMIYTVRQNGMQLAFLQHGLIVDNKLYVLTFSGKADVFEKYYPEMERVMLSFTPL